MDEVTDIKAWETEFLKPEAREVVEAIGAWIYCFRRPWHGKIGEEVEDTLRAIQSVAEKHAGYGADTVMLAVSIPDARAGDNREKEDEVEEWSDVCMQYGFEYISYGARGRNEYGEKLGFERVKEALEANEWAAPDDDDEEQLDLNDLDFDGAGSDDLDGLGREQAEMTAELFGMKAELAGLEGFEPEAGDFLPPERQAAQVDGLDRMLGRLLAVKEQGAELPEAQRKRMAAQAVRDIMEQDKGS